ncbi:cytochrome c oxidase assembly COX19 [Lecanosticta acicola]|uniref:Cytochrome c oxidase assembly COX19 n=1 Tax=Lecanosticta acicola TaxID=111012 RepID=A0AAI9E8K5_9PEZI|nr:cytochrome c oxidase assembly COX19 [Lecanosticta acicola]
MTTLGGPGGGTKFSKPSPPERGSFPLDHEAECQPIMKEYLKCLRRHRGVNDDLCRQLSKSYLQCRMERNLMAPDSMRNLGFHDPESEAQAAAAAAKTGDGDGSRNLPVAGRNEQSER